MMLSVRRIALGVPLFVCFAGCGDDEDKNVPPAGNPTTGLTGVASMSGTPTTGDTSSTGDTTGDTTGSSTGSTGGTSSTTTGAGSTGSTGGTGTSGSTGAVTDLLSGQFIDGSGGTYVPPFTCSVRFFGLGDIEPTTGVSTGFALQQTFTIDSFPSAWVVTVDSAGGAIAVDDVGYVGAVCDVDGDLLNDDNVGGWVPALPLEQVTVPAEGLDISIADL